MMITLGEIIDGYRMGGLLPGKTPSHVDDSRLGKKHGGHELFAARFHSLGFRAGPPSCLLAGS